MTRSHFNFCISILGGEALSHLHAVGQGAYGGQSPLWGGSVPRKIEMF